MLIFKQPAAIACQLAGRTALLAGNWAERTTIYSGRFVVPMNQIEGSTSGFPCQDIRHRLEDLLDCCDDFAADRLYLCQCGRGLLFGVDDLLDGLDRVFLAR